MTNQSPAEALRQHYKQEIEYVLETSDETGEVRITYADGHSEIKPAKVLLLDDIMHFVDAYVTAYAATVEREAAEESLNLWKGWLAYVESGGGHINRRQIKEMIAELEEHLAALQGPQNGDSN